MLSMSLLQIQTALLSQLYLATDMPLWAGIRHRRRNAAVLFKAIQSTTTRRRTDRISVSTPRTCAKFAHFHLTQHSWHFFNGFLSDVTVDSKTRNVSLKDLSPDTQYTVNVDARALTGITTSSDEKFTTKKFGEWSGSDLEGWFRMSLWADYLWFGAPNTTLILKLRSSWWIINRCISTIIMLWHVRPVKIVISVDRDTVLFLLFCFLDWTKYSKKCVVLFILCFLATFIFKSTVK